MIVQMIVLIVTYSTINQKKKNILIKRTIIIVHRYNPPHNDLPNKRGRLH